jgi:hypothetical protein
MEYKQNSFSIKSIHEPYSVPDRDLSLNNTRKKLLEQAFLKDKTCLVPKPSRPSRSSERISNIPSKLSSKTLKKPSEEQKKPIMNPERLHRSKSPACTQRNKSSEARKISNSNKYSREKNAEKIRTTIKSPEKNIESISKAAYEFSIKKMNVIYNKELKEFCYKDDQNLCRALIALLADIDYHIKESSHYPIETFIEYVSSPGIIVQNIKRLPDLIVEEKVPLSKLYLESILAAYEIFNKIQTVSNSTGHLLLAGLLAGIFRLQGLDVPCISFASPSVKTVRKLNSSFIDTKNSSKPSKIRKKTESLSISSIPKPSEDTYPKTLENSIAISLNQTCELPVSSKTFEGYQNSKKILLDKFISKMSYPETPKQNNLRNPFKELNKAEIRQISPMQFTRPLSATPRVDLENIEKKSIGEYKYIKNLIPKNRIGELNIKKIMVGSRFYKKIDEKFVEVMLGKLKKDTKDLIRAKNENFDEYLKKKSEVIQANKNNLIKETIITLENSEFFISSNENESLLETKLQAMQDYLSQEKNINRLVLRAERLEVSSRKL